MTQRYISTVHIIVSAESESDACDVMSATLTETLKYPGHIVDWAYMRRDDNDASIYGSPYLHPVRLTPSAPADLEDECLTRFSEASIKEAAARKKVQDLINAAKIVIDNAYVINAEVHGRVGLAKEDYENLQKAVLTVEMMQNG